MTDKELESLLYGKCIRLISKRPRSVWEITQYLNKKSTRSASLTTDYGLLTTTIIKKLVSTEFLNDTAFIDWWVDSRSSFKPKGKRALIVELKQKGIQNDDIEAYFESHGLNEEALAREVLRKKERTLRLLDPKLRTKKATELLLRRGFSYDVAKRAIE